MKQLMVETLESLSNKHVGPAANTSDLDGKLNRSNAMVGAQTAQLMRVCTTLSLSPASIDPANVWSRAYMPRGLVAQEYPRATSMNTPD